ncbi:MAG: hypothetical protein AAGK21_02120 [Bacteroidota bacterium]
MPRVSFYRGALLASLAIAFSASGCDHLTDPDGPNLVDRFGDFTLLDPLTTSASAADFAAGDAVTFSARFNKQANWVLEIVGQQSGAVRRIEGFSSELTPENARWTGGTTELPLFNVEDVEARLFFPNEDGTDTTRVSLAVTSPRAYPGDLVSDFEGGGNTIRLGNFEFELQGAGVSSEVPAGQGDSFYLFRGTEPPSGSTRNFFVGLIDILPPAGTFHSVPTTVPEDLFVNFFLYGFGTTNTIAVVQVISDGNGNGQFEDGDTVFVAYDGPADFEGWRAFSANLGELGMTQAQAQEIVSVRVLLISDDNNQPATPLQVEYGIDFITFTAGGPLQL